MDTLIFCVDCKFHFDRAMDDRCYLAPNLDPVKGVTSHRMCTFRRTDPYDLCGPAGKQFQRKESST